MRVRKHVLIVLICSAAALALCDLTEDSSETALRALRSAMRGNGLRPGKKVTVDDQGVPLVDYGWERGFHIGEQRNPVTVARHGLDYYARYRAGDESAKVALLSCADWLVAHAVRRGKSAVLEYNFPWPGYGVRPPWRSAMAQAVALQVLGRAYELTGRVEYLDSAKALLALFFVDVEHGGVTRKDSDERWWYEECAAQGAAESRILNGMMYTLLGLWDYHNRTGDEEAGLLFRRGRAALEHALPAYDRGGYSSYDGLGQPAFRYHAVHVALLARLYAITKSPTLKTYHDRWAAYAKMPFAVRLVKGPDKIKLAVFAFNALVVVGVSEVSAYVISRRRRARTTSPQ